MFLINHAVEAYSCRCELWLWSELADQTGPDIRSESRPVDQESHSVVIHVACEAHVRSTM